MKSMHLLCHLILFLSLGFTSYAEEVDVYLFGGQSNMQGLGKISELKAQQLAPPENVFYWNGDSFEPYIPGTTVTASAGEFGPELAFAHAVSNPHRKSYLIKHMSSGMPLDSAWSGSNYRDHGDPPAPNRTNYYPGTSPSDPNQGTLYKNLMLPRFKAGLADLTVAGYTPVIRKFLWMQGEQDSKMELSAGRYAANLKRLHNRLAEDLGLTKPTDLPMVFGQVLPYEPHEARFTYRDLIRTQQASADMDSGLANAIPACRMISTDHYTLKPDHVHYDTAGQLQLGADFAAGENTLSITGDFEDPNPTPTPVQLAWQQAELGVVFHYDLHIFDNAPYNQEKNRRIAYPDPNIFNPTQLDTDQWVRTAKSMGATFAIFTASHETGFRMWQSDASPEYSLKAVKWGDGKRDIVAEFIASCKKYDLKPSIYMGTRWNSHRQVLDFKPTKNSKISIEDYNTQIEAEVTEICSRYGDLFELWFDGGAYGPKDGGPDVLSIFEKYQKNCLFYHNYERADARWGGSESGTVPYPCWASFPFSDGYEAHRKISHANGFKLLKEGDPNGQYWCPAMSDSPLRSYKWFWNKGEENALKSLDHMVNMIHHSTGRNSTLIVGLTPDDRGLMPDADVKLCKEVGDEMKRLFSNQIATTSGKGKLIELDLGKSQQIDKLVLKEDIAQGERVRLFTIQYLSEGKWKKLYDGSSIGQKHIIRVKSVTTSKLRLNISSSIADPIISTFSAYLTPPKQ